MDFCKSLISYKVLILSFFKAAFILPYKHTADTKYFLIIEKKNVFETIKFLFLKIDSISNDLTVYHNYSITFDYY